MNFLELLTSMVAQIGELQTALQDAQATADKLVKEAYDKGFADGVASVPPVGEDTTPFSQADIDAAVAAAVAPMNEQIVALQAEVEGLKAQIEQVKSEAVAAFKAELLAKYEEMQVVESQLETGFGEMLK
jgi:uncharacterized small protein (DUF1192 family)